MGEYLFNVGMSMSAYVGGAIALIILIITLDKLALRSMGKTEYKANKTSINRAKRVGYLLASVILIAGVYVSVLGPQRTYKNQTLDTYQHAKQIKYWNEADGQVEDRELESRLRPDKLTTEERQDRFDDLSDWRTGSKTGE